MQLHWAHRQCKRKQGPSQGWVRVQGRLTLAEGTGEAVRLEALCNAASRRRRRAGLNNPGLSPGLRIGRAIVGASVNAGVHLLQGAHGRSSIRPG